MIDSKNYIFYKKGEKYFYSPRKGDGTGVKFLEFEDQNLGKVLWEKQMK